MRRALRLLLNTATTFALALTTSTFPLRASDQAPQRSRDGGAGEHSGWTTTTLPDGRVLIIGDPGHGVPRGSVVIHDPKTRRSVALPSLYQPRTLHAAVLLADGSVLIVGGVDRNGQALDVAELIRPDAAVVEPVHGLTIARARHSATVLRDGRVLIAGGTGPAGGVLQTAELWDPAGGAAVLLESGMVTARSGHAATLLPDGTIRLSRGAGSSDVPSTDEIFDPVARKFRSAPYEAESSQPAYLSATDPFDGARNVPLMSRLMLHFSKPVILSGQAGGGVRLSAPAGDVSVAVVPTEGGRLLFVRPDALQPDTTYTLRVVQLTDAAGLPVPEVSLRFTTAADAKSTAADEAEDWTPDPWRGDGWRTNRPDSPWQTLPPLQAGPGDTAVSGQVLLLNGKPFADVTLSVAGRNARSDRSGRFLLTGLPDGRHQLVIDGRSASAPGRAYGVFQFRLDLRAAQTTVLPFTIWMPRIDTAHAIKITSPTRAVTVTTPRIPGLELHIPNRVTIKDHEGRPAGEISITPIPVDRPPFPLPTGVDIPVYFTIQPGGGFIEGKRVWPAGAKLVYPNYRAERPGTRINFWNYDPADRGWHVYGLGTVERTGRQVVPDAGTSIYEFTGAMINDGQSPPPDGPTPGGPKDGDPVDLGTGLFVYEKTDLYLPDVIPLAITRTYRPNDSANRLFGIGTTHPYAMFLWSAQQYQEADLILPDGGHVHYVRISPGTGFTDAEFEHSTTPTLFYKSRIKWNGNGWDLTLKDGTVHVFGELAPLQSIRDRNGNVLKLTWSNTNSAGSGNGNILRVSSPHGRWIEFTYDTSNRVTQAKDNIGRAVGYTYDANGRLWKVTDPAGGITEYTYDSSHRMLTIKDARGITYLTNEYDANGRVARQTQADGTTYQFAYTLDGSNRVVQADVTNPRGYVNRYALNTSRQLTSLVKAVGTAEQQSFTYERQTGANLLLSVTDPLNRRTEYTYDLKGNPTTVRQLAGTPDAVSTTFAYEQTFSQLTSLTDPLNHTTAFGYDAKGNLLSITDPLNAPTTFTYNSAGQVLTITNPLNQTTQFAYDLGDLVSVTNPFGSSETRFADAGGRLVRRTDPAGNAAGYEYNALNLVTAVTDPLGGRTSFGYDANGNLLSVTEARNNTTSSTYNSMDRVAARTDPLTRQESYLYDANGNLRQVTDRKSQVTTYTYDPLDRVTLANYADGSTTGYTYDAGDRITQIADSIAGTITRGYDLLDRFTSETTPEGSVTHTYDAAGRRATFTVAGQPVVNYTYDNADRLTGITQGSSSATLTYDNADRRASLTLPNGILVEYSYDAASQLTGLTYKLGGSTLGTLTYSYDGTGNRISVGGTYARTGLPAAVTSATYNAANQLTQWGAAALSYDLNGNLTADGSKTYTWDARNRLTAIAGAVSASFQYDGFGRRRSRTVGGSATEYLHDELNVVQELTSGAPAANLVTGLSIDEVLTRTDSVGTRHFLPDALGSTIALADANAIVHTEYTYEPFGNTTAAGAPSSNAFHYTNREEDGTGLYYYRARYYSPRWQRFISEDPIEFASGDANLYAYVWNQPTSWADPLGLVAFLPPPGCLPPGRKDPPQIDFWCTQLPPPIPLGMPPGVGPRGPWGRGPGAPGAGPRGPAGPPRGAPPTGPATDPTLQHFERQLARDGTKSLEKSLRSLEKRLVEHLEKLERYTREGGHTSKTRTEVQAFQRQIAAIKSLLGRQ